MGHISFQQPYAPAGTMRRHNDDDIFVFDKAILLLFLN